MINLPDLADRLNQYGIMNKSFLAMNKSEILLLVNSVFSSIDNEVVPPGGWMQPAIVDGTLLIDFAAHPKYHWWTPDGQSIIDTLIEIDAPWEVARKYIDSKTMTEEAYLNKLIPF